MSASQNNSAVQQEIASVNGVALNVAEDVLSADELRQRACSELLRQAAVSSEFLSASDTSGTTGILSEAGRNAL